MLSSWKGMDERVTDSKSENDKQSVTDGWKQIKIEMYKILLHWITGRGQKKKGKWRKAVLRRCHPHLHKHKHTHSLICQSNKERQARATFAWQTGPARLIEEKTILGDRLTVWYGACHLWVGLRTHNRSVCVHLGGWLICLWACVWGCVRH